MLHASRGGLAFRAVLVLAGVAITSATAALLRTKSAYDALRTEHASVLAANAKLLAAKEVLIRLVQAAHLGETQRKTDLRPRIPVSRDDGSIVAFVSPNCPHCVPALVQLAAHARAGTVVEVISIDSDSTTIARWRKRYSIELPVSTTVSSFQHEQLAKAAGGVTPIAFRLRSSGCLLDLHIGALSDSIGATLTEKQRDGHGLCE
jgi:hypothetical protein